MLSKKEIKERHFKRVYDNAKMIECKCGCGTKIKNKDRYGRDKEYVNGHNNRKYDDPKQYKREWNNRNKESKGTYRRLKRRERKIYLIKYMGAKCIKCGLEYNGTNARVFDFHHLINKSFGVSGNTMEKSIIKLEIECDKCILLCANCHRLEHHKGE